MDQELQQIGYREPITLHAAGRLDGFSRNDVMSAILKVCGHIQNPTLSIDAYLAYSKHNPAKFHPDRI